MRVLRNTMRMWHRVRLNELTVGSQPDNSVVTRIGYIDCLIVSDVDAERIIEWDAARLSPVGQHWNKCRVW